MPRDTEQAGRDVLFLLYPTPGHVTPNLAVVAELAGRGHRVRVVVAERFAPAVVAAGGDPLPFDPPLAELPSLAGLTEDDWAEASKDVFLDVIKASRAIADLVAADRPDLLAFDSALWAPARLVTARAGIPAVQLVPTTIDREPFTPGSVRIGERDDAAEAQRLASFGAALVSLFAAHGLPGATTDAFAAHPDERVVAYVPRGFQPDADRFDDRYTFAGPCLPAQPGDGAWQPPAGAGRVLLLSLGTTSNDRLGLFTDCVRAFTDSDWHVVITLGGRFTPDDLGPLPPNVEAHSWVRHPQVLAHAAAFVCQAGMGSVMEALAHAVPVVAVPSHPEAIANGARLAELGLGTTLPAAEVTGAAVRRAVEAVADDPAAARRLGAMREHIHRSGGAPAAADVIERVANERVLEDR
ncbi:macrolide family glycosyltransferase [Actinokineospora bangkokensis]|uniref:Erythromycin biosynthesis protein CIII-like C-terminal domain-containing protein n=1 Tax=Actinokineospora bangkokensis TaxID=1193682 RepID=A0A1Q9LP55_9PSEU|nr:macrolide family glycosyltransferase [Actinokineospora bangkokensis]OLR93783.1 hypothetical protein BJP25_16200 [Actinokineospora bangkokensis]